MKKIVLTFMLLAGIIASAQETTNSEKVLDAVDSENKKKSWTKRGTSSILLNQAAFSDWVAGGTNSTALTLRGDYEVNYKQGKHFWDNRLILGYGIQKNKGQEQRKQEDIIDLTSKYGHEIKKNWYASAALNFRTQFDKGYDYKASTVVYNSNFMAPGYLTVGFGIDYKPNKKFEISIHPLTSKMTFVTDENLQLEGLYGLKNNGDSFVYELGVFLGARHRFQIMENVIFDHRIGIYSNYLDKPQNMDVLYQALLDLQINKYLSAQLTFDALYDEDQIKRTQIKQTLGVGLSYSFGEKK